MENIERAKSDIEKQDSRDLLEVDGKTMFLNKLSVEEAKATKEMRPFDGYAARMEYEDIIADAERLSVRKHGYVRTEDMLKIKFDGLSKYGDMKRFEKVKDDEKVVHRVNKDGIVTEIVTGYKMFFVGKAFENGITVFVDIESYDKKFGKDKK